MLSRSLSLSLAVAGCASETCSPLTLPNSFARCIIIFPLAATANVATLKHFARARVAAPAAQLCPCLPACLPACLLACARCLCMNLICGRGGFLFSGRESYLSVLRLNADFGNLSGTCYVAKLLLEQWESWSLMLKINKYIMLVK